MRHVHLFAASRAALKSERSIHEFRFRFRFSLESHSSPQQSTCNLAISPIVGRNERDRTLLGERPAGRDRCARSRPCRGRSAGRGNRAPSARRRRPRRAAAGGARATERAVRHQETVRRGFVRAAHLGIADRRARAPACRRSSGSMPKPDTTSSRSSGPSAGDRAADRLVDQRVVRFEHAAVARAARRRVTSPNRGRHRVAQEVVADRIEALVAHDRDLRRVAGAQRRAQCGRRSDRCAPAPGAARAITSLAGTAVRRQRACSVERRRSGCSIRRIDAPTDSPDADRRLREARVGVADDDSRARPAPDRSAASSTTPTRDARARSRMLQSVRVRERRRRVRLLGRGTRSAPGSCAKQKSGSS